MTRASISRQFWRQNSNPQYMLLSEFLLLFLKTKHYFHYFFSEYKRLFDRVVALTHLNLDRLQLGSSSWGNQFREAMTVNGGDVENATSMDYVMHFLTFAWKVCYGNMGFQSF